MYGQKRNESSTDVGDDDRVVDDGVDGNLGGGVGLAVGDSVSKSVGCRNGNRVDGGAVGGGVDTAIGDNGSIGSGNSNNGNATNNNNHRHNDRYDDNISDELYQEFMNAIEDIPPEKSGSFWYAWTSHPRLVNEESDFKMFLNHHNNDVEKAAIRICNYWETRVELFGYDDAFKPMSIDGAMHDVVPYLARLPNSAHILPDDDNGRIVVCFDREGLSFRNDDGMVPLKIMWYTFHLAMYRQLQRQRRRNFGSNNDGIVIIAINQFNTWDYPGVKLFKLVKIMALSLPLKIDFRHHILTSLMASILIPIGRLTLPKYSLAHSKVHSNVNKRKLLDDLQTFGLQRDNLPKSIGGNWNGRAIWVDECKEILDRNRHEQDLEREQKQQSGSKRNRED